jgi:hypothetical protein
MPQVEFEHAVSVYESLLGRPRDRNLTFRHLKWTTIWHSDQDTSLDLWSRLAGGTRHVVWRGLYSTLAPVAATINKASGEGGEVKHDLG